MCEFCVKHGEGKTWYLRAENYAEDLLSDLRRRRFIEEFVSRPEHLADGARRLERLDHAPAFVRRAVAWIGRRKFKKVSSHSRKIGLASLMRSSTNSFNSLIGLLSLDPWDLT